MQWYLLKTWTGREEELVKEIRRTVPSYMYEDVFVIYTERIWRRQGRSIVHPEPLFHGCAFLTCRDSEPIWRRMGQVPFLAQWMAAGYLTVYPLMEKDAEFLQQISGDEHVMRLSYVLRERNGLTGTEGTDRYRVSGPLEYCMEDIDNIEFRKRFVKPRKRLWGEDLVIAMGIVLNEDVEQGVVCGGVKADVKMLDGWTMLEIRKDADGKRLYVRGEKTFPEKGMIYSVNGKTDLGDGTEYPTGNITVLSETYGEIARVG